MAQDKHALKNTFCCRWLQNTPISCHFPNSKFIHLPPTKEDVYVFASVRLSVSQSVCLSVCLSVSKISQQKLSYRKQIARQLRTQYVDGIYRSNYHDLEI